MLFSHDTIASVKCSKTNPSAWPFPCCTSPVGYDVLRQIHQITFLKILIIWYIYVSFRVPASCIVSTRRRWLDIHILFILAYNLPKQKTVACSCHLTPGEYLLLISPWYYTGKKFLKLKSYGYYCTLYVKIWFQQIGQDLTFYIQQ